MAKLGINTGSSPNDGLGDSLLSGAIKINSNFNEIYNAIGNGTNITNTIAFATTAYSINTNANINVGFATISNLDVGIGGSSLIVTNDGIIAIGTDITDYKLEIYKKTILINDCNVSSINSNVGIGTTLPTIRLQVEGNTYISGVSTFAGITTVTGSTLFSKQLNVSGVSTFAGITTVTGSTLFTKQLNVSGVSTFNSNISIPTASVGIGTTNPLSKIHVVGGDIRVGINTSNGLILTSPNGTKYRLIVDNFGNLSTVVTS